MKKIIILALLAMSLQAESMCTYYLNNSNKYMTKGTYAKDMDRKEMYKGFAIDALIDAKFSCNATFTDRIQTMIDNLEGK